MIKHYWPHKSIQTLFFEAKEKGTVSFELPTEQDALLFRFALYNARRRNRQLRKDPIFLEMKIDINGKKLTIFKPNQIEIKLTGTENA
jgi:hypothetical protein